MVWIETLELVSSFILCLLTCLVIFCWKLDMIYWIAGTKVGFPDSSAGKESTCNAGDLGSIPGLARSPGGGHGSPLQYSCLENPHGQRSLAGYSPWGRKEVDTTEWLSATRHRNRGKQTLSVKFYVNVATGWAVFHVPVAAGVRDFKVQECGDALLPGGTKLRYSLSPRKLSYVMHVLWTHSGFPGDIVVKSSPAHAGDAKDVGLIPWRRKWQLTLVFLPGESHGQRSLAGHSLWGCK